MPKGSQFDLSRNKILSALVPEEVRRLLPHLKLVTVRLGQVLYRNGEPFDVLYFPEEGVILSVVTELEDGKTVEVNSIGGEGFFSIRAMLGAAVSLHSAIVQVPGRCFAIDVRTLRAEFDRCGKLHRSLLQFVHRLLVDISQTAVCNRVHRLEQRMARWLLMLHDRAKSSEFPITHDVLSQILGTPRSEVTLAAGTFRKAGYIKYARGRIRIESRKGLESAACECYRVVAEALNSPR